MLEAIGIITLSIVFFWGYEAVASRWEWVHALPESFPSGRIANAGLFPRGGLT